MHAAKEFNRGAHKETLEDFTTVRESKKRVGNAKQKCTLRDKLALGPSEGNKGGD